MGSMFKESPYAGKLKVINLWAGPGAGKSTTAAALFNLMKRERFEVELVTEVAKGLSYEKRWNALGNQLLVLAKQENQLRRLIGQCEYAVVDSPFPIGLVYQTYTDKRLDILIDCLWEDYANFSFRLSRTTKAFQAFGRHHDEEQSIALDAQINDLSIDYGAGDFPVMDPDDIAVEYKILDKVLRAQGLFADASRLIRGDGE